MSTTETAPQSPYPRPKPEEPQFTNESLFKLSLIVIFGIFASTIPQPQVLGNIPLKNILKNELHEPAKFTSLFFLIIGFFWYIKPLAGILTDAFPLRGTRRRHYMLFSAVLAAASWILLGLVPHSFVSLFVGCLILSLFMVMISTVTGAILVEVGQAHQATGRLTGVRQITSYACNLITSPLGGVLAAMSFAWVAGVGAALVLSVFPVAYVLVRERRVEVGNTEAFSNAGRQLKTMLSSGPFWFAIVFIGLYFFAPGFGTLQFYRQQNVMHLDTRHQGYLGFFGAGGSILAALVYVGVVKRLPIRASLLFGVATAAASSILYLFYNNWSLAIPIDFQSGFFGGFAEVSLIDLAARATPPGCEGLGYSCILSMRNLSVFGADQVGSYLSDTYHWSWGTMVWLNGVTTAVVLILLPFIPRQLMRSKDAAT